eukprot:Sdes_comp19068_c0_seq1m9671
MESALQAVRIPFDSENNQEWLEKLDVDSLNPCVLDNVEDDFKREDLFYQQALEAALLGKKRLESMGIQTERPADFFAEMIKSDDHMRKVRQNILDQKLAVERSEKVKKIREMKKFGKQVQTEILKNRQKKKSQDLDAIKKYRTTNSNKLGMLKDDQDFQIQIDETNSRKRKNVDDSKNSDEKMNHQQERKKQKSNIDENASKKSNSKRLKKNQKYGFGGKKRGSKRNDSKSSSDMKKFNSVKNKQLFSATRPLQPSKNPQKRLGKSRRVGKKNSR